MVVFHPEKVIGGLPSTLTPNAVYFVRVGSGIMIYVADATGSTAYSINQEGGGTEIADGDKGDITISNSGTTWTIDNQSVTYSKLQQTNSGNIALGKPTNGSGTITEIPIGVGANNLIQLDSTAKLPAVDGSQLTNLPVLSASQIRDSLATLTGSNRLDASAIKNLPSGGSGGLNTVSPTSNNFPVVANDLVIANNFSVVLPNNPLENTVIYFLVLGNPCQINSTNVITLNLQLLVTSFKINTQGFIIPLLFKNARWNILSNYVSDIVLAPTVTLVENLSQPSNFGFQVTSSQWLSLSFQTGNNSYTLNSVSLKIGQAALGSLFVKLYSNASGDPGTEITSFNVPSIGSTTNYVFTLPNSQLLTANTTYWLVAGILSGSGQYVWVKTNSTAETGLPGWSIGDLAFFSTDGGNIWNSFVSPEPFQFSVNGIVNT